MPLPTGSGVTFVFTDIEGSTRHEQAIGSAAWADIVGRHDQILRAAIEDLGGSVVKTEGDAFFAAFATPAAAVEAIVLAQRRLGAERWPGQTPLRVRAGLHLGEGRLRLRTSSTEPEDYVGIDVNYAARISAAANGGQVVLSDALAGALAADLPDLLSRLAATVVDEGLHRVKDFDQPARLMRLVIAGAADDARPLRTLEPPSNLPGEATSLIGRDEEIEALAKTILANRIVTLSGPGGSGKTRLAIGVAAAVRMQFPHGTWFVDLASVRDAGLTEATIAAVLGVRDSLSLAIDAALLVFLRDRELLLVLDNLEQLLPAVATRVAALVRAAAHVRVIATTRELLRIGGEYGHVVPPLDRSAGIALFEDRARLHRPDLSFGPADRAVIVAICERLAGLPLAIELAAARVRLLPLPAILERLGRSLDLAGGARDLPERQRTLRGAIDWSHDLLTEPEQRLFRRLAVFAGGWTPETLVEVVDLGDLELDLADGLESLVDKSLVRVEQPGGHSEVGAASAGPRFSLHPLLREYAAERLAASGETDRLEARHAAAYVALAVRDGGRIMGPDGGAVLRSLDLEQHNLRAAVERLIRVDDPVPAIELLAATWRWYQQRGRLREGRGLLAQLLDRPASGADPRVLVAGLEADGGLAYWMEDMAAAETRYAEQLALAETLGDPSLMAAAHYNSAFPYMVAEQQAPLRAHAARAVELYTAVGDEMGIRRARQALNVADFLVRDYAAALAREQDNLEFFRREQRRFNVADSLTLLSAVQFQRGEPDRSWSLLLEALSIFSELDLASGLARALGMAAIIQLEHGDAELGARIAGATLELGRTRNVMVAPTRVLHLPAIDALAIERLGDERARDLMADGAAIPIEAIVATVLATPAPGASRPDMPRGTPS